ncbi:hypothetical protein CLOP_g21184 [Closterium sp. NIES-67]|nr:hypothetical protein CLOP_g21184 [Closterium sp. NIES-67]
MAASAAAEGEASTSSEDGSFTEPEEGWVGRLGVPVAMVGDPCEEVMLLWGLRDPFTARMGCFVDQAATTVRIEACGQVLDMLQSPSCLVRPGVTGSVLWDSGVVLAKALEHLADSARLPIRGSRCLELGAGCGLVGIVAALLGASHVHITDQFDRLRLLHRNVCHNLLPSHPLSAPSSSSSSHSHGSSSSHHASARKAPSSSGSGGGSGGGAKCRGGAGKGGSAAAAAAARAAISDGGTGGGGGDSGAWPEVVELTHGRKGEETRVRVRVFELEWGEDMVLPRFDGDDDDDDEVLQFFLEQAQPLFTVGRLPDAHLHPDFISRRVVVYCLARRRV